MTQQDWQDCPTFQSVAAALERGDQIEVRGTTSEWVPWLGILWRNDYKFRCRPAKPKVKTVVMREIEVMQHNLKIRMFVSDLKYTGNEREEVPE